VKLKREGDGDGYVAAGVLAVGILIAAATVGFLAAAVFAVRCAWEAGGA